MKHICMNCHEDIDPNDIHSTLQQQDNMTGFVHYECLDTFTEAFLKEAEA